MSEYQLIHNVQDHQYEFHIDGVVADLGYKIDEDGIMYIEHVGVPKALEGQGIASNLVEKVFIELDQQNVKIIPICPFVIKYIERHPEWERLVKKE